MIQSLTAQVSNDYLLAPVDDLADVTNDVFVIFLLHQILVLHEIAHRFLNHIPKWGAFPTRVRMFQTFRDSLDALVIVDSCHEHDVLTVLN